MKIQFPLFKKIKEKGIMDYDTLEILQFIYMATTVATFLFNIICIRKEILGEVLDMIPSERNTLYVVQLPCMK